MLSFVSVRSRIVSTLVLVWCKLYARDFEESVACPSSRGKRVRVGSSKSRRSAADGACMRTSQEIIASGMLKAVSCADDWNISNVTSIFVEKESDGDRWKSLT